MIKQYVVDAFTDEILHGNPAAVCVLEDWLAEGLMQDIAKENRLSETAFVVKEEAGYQLRWFTPGGEIDLCGHATLATAFVLLNYYEKDVEEVSFQTLSGQLDVARKGDLYEMTFPAYPLKKIAVTDEMEAVLGVRPQEAWLARDLVCLLPSEKDVRELRPDLELAQDLPGLLLHATAGGKDYDSVTRSFAPKLAIDEAPVCGSGHCHTCVLWAEKLGKKELKACQASERGGELYCRVQGDKVLLAGKAVLFSVAELRI